MRDAYFCFFQGRKYKTLQTSEQILNKITNMLHTAGRFLLKKTGM